jgi:hypothetical protein
MGLSTRVSYLDCYEVLDRALAEEIGLKLKFTREGDASHFRLRLNSARALNRRENAEIYQQGDPLYGSSIYDKLVIKYRLRDGVHWLLIQHRTADLPETEAMNGFDKDLIGNSREAEGKGKEAIAEALETLKEEKINKRI